MPTASLLLLTCLSLPALVPSLLPDVGPAVTSALTVSPQPAEQARPQEGIRGLWGHPEADWAGEGPGYLGLGTWGHQALCSGRKELGSSGGERRT